MSLYTGYAQQKGFDPIQIPGLEEKIRQQGKEEYRDREEAIAWNNQEAKRTAANFDRDATLELQTREVNHKLRQNFAEILAKNEWNNFERTIKHAQKGSTGRLDDIKNLLSLTKTGASLVEEWNQKREKDATSFARDLYNKYGLGPEEYDAIRSIDDAQFRYQMRTNGNVYGITDEKIAWKVKNSGGYLDTQVHILGAQRLARGYRALYEEKRTTEYELTGDDENPVMVSLATANSEQIDEVLRLIEKDERDETGDNWPSARIWELSGAYKIAEAARVIERKRVNEAELNDIRRQTYEGIWNELEAQMNRPNDIGDRSGVVGINSAIMLDAGGSDAPRQNIVQSRKKHVNAVIEALKTGRFKWSEIKGLERLEIKVRGQEKPVLWGDYFKPEWARIEAAGKIALKKEYDEAQMGVQEHKIAELDFFNDVSEIVSNGEDNVETLTKLLGIAQQNGFAKPSQYLTKVLAWSNNRINDTAAEAILKQRVANNEIITPDEIDALHMSFGASAGAKALALKHNNYLPQPGKDGTAERLKERIERELQIVIPKQNSWSSNSSHKDASIAAYKAASSDYRAAREKGQSHEDAYKYAMGEITKTIRDKDGDYGPVTVDGIKHFRKFGANLNQDIIPNDIPKIKAELTSDYNLIYTKPYIEREHLLRKSARLNKNLSTPVLERAEVIRSVTGGVVLPIDLEVAQIELYRNIDIAKTGSSDLQQYPEWYINKARKTEKIISPEAQRLLSDYNYSKVNQASLKSGNNIIYQKPVIDKARITGKKFSGGNYNSIGGETDSVSKLGYSLTGSTIREVMILMDGGRFETAGAYTLDYNMIETATKEAGLSLENHFTPDVQDDLFEILFKSGAWKPDDEQLEEDEKLFFMETSTNLNNDKIDKKYGFHNPMLVNIKSRKALMEMGRYA